MREHTSRTAASACRFTAARFVVSLCGIVFALLASLGSAEAQTSDFGDYSSFAGASSTRNSTLRIGATVDAESSATTNSSATGDDNTGSDDEDGVTVPAAIIQGTSTSLTVNVTNTRGSTAYLNVWVDFNRNGSLTDSGEQVASNTTIANGTSNSNRTVSFTVPAGASLGTAGVRVRLTSGSNPGADGADGTGEVEDYVTIIGTNSDHGDHSSYPSASSLMNSSLRIGATVDAEGAPTTNSTATGDDTTGNDDEDGVTVPASLMLGAASSMTANVTNTSGSSAYLNAWIDYNRNGVFTDSGEQVTSNTVISTGTSGSNRTLSFTVPSGASPGVTGVRVRLTSVSSPGSDGADGTGEVEDYTVTLAPNLSIGNLIWNDANENGLYDVGESGINNVLVELWTPGADNAIGGTSTNADTKVASVTTAGGGLYSFSGLAAGYYFVRVPTPPLSRTSIVVDTTDNGQDGDNNASQPGGSSTAAFSPVIQLSIGTEPGSAGTGNVDNTVDFGFAANIGSPFVCDNRFYVIQNAETSSGSGVYDSTLYYVGDGPSLVPVFVFEGYKLNGLAAYGGYLYCVDQNGNHLYRINSMGTLVDMGAIPGLPTPASGGQWSGATALTSGRMILNLYTFSPATTTLYTIELASATLVGSGVVVKNAGTGGTTYEGNFGDIAWDPLTNKVYGYSTVDTDWLGLFEINTSTGMSTRVSATVPGSWGSIIIDANGLTYGFGSAGATGAQDTLYIFNRTNGVLNGSITAVGSGPAVSNSDGAACPGAPPSMKLGNQIWNDVDNDGVKEAGEAGIDGVTLQLFLGGQNPLTAAPAATTTSSGGGFYTFNNLSPGQYFVYIPTPPAAFPLSSVPTTTTDNSVNNDDNGIQTAKSQPVRSPLIGLAGGTESDEDGDTDINTDLTVDFGFLAATADFGDHSAFASASQAASTSIRVGTTATDTEGATPTTANAAGDDTAETDDEDLTMPSVVSGGEASLSIPVTLSGGLTLGRIGVWADWNGDGDVLDTNEAVTLSGTGLIDGLNTITATLTPPAGTSVGTKYLRIRVAEGTAAVAFSGNSTLRGEVEDYAISVTAPTLDYGDLPDTIIGTSASNYQTLSNDNGPTHTANTSLRLGSNVDAEGNGQPNSTATGDGSDDDGVPTLPTLTQGQSATLTMTATNSFGAAGFLKAWIDWNNDGNLTAAEELGTQISVPNGTSNGSFNFTFTVPGTSVTGVPLGLRIRLASATIPASTGPVGTGEVEDYLITVNTSTADFGDHASFAAASRTATTQIRVGTAATDADAAYPTSGTASADDSTGTDDEDLTMPILLAGTSGTLSIPITLTSPVTTGRVGVWADWNGDNDVADTNEVVSLSTASLVTGTNTITATLSPPLGITAGTKVLRVIATEGTTAPSFSGNSTLKGEVEDYAITVNTTTLDFGDLPDTGAGTGAGNYQTLNSDSGPSHTTTPNTLRLGATVDTEADGQPNITAVGDGGDEDGIASMPVFERGLPYTIPVSVLNNTGSMARIFGFIDWNDDGDFADSGEALSAVTVSTLATQQSINITGTTPGTVALGTFGARFRVASATTLTSTGTTGTGEVEDYLVTGACPTISITPASLPATTQYSSYTSTLTATGGITPYSWQVTSGAIPSGLVLSTAGAFSGSVISASGAYAFTVRVTDANGCTASKTYTISVGSGGMSAGNLVFLDENNNGLKDSNERGIPNVPVEIWSVGADGRVNSADDQPVLSGTASTLDSGGMLTLGSFGSIAPGFSTLTARTDWNGAYQFTELPTGAFYFKVTPPNKTVFSSKFGAGTTTYSLNLDFPLASTTSILVDNGIDDDNNGVQTTGSFAGAGDAAVAGVGAAVFSMPFTLSTGTEPGTSNEGSDDYTLDFGLRPCPAIGIATITLPVVKSGVAYTHPLAASGGATPYTYAITQGTLPSGLSMSTAGVISGTSSATGTSAITVRATDARGCQGFTTLQVNVAAGMSITTASLPNGVEGSAYTTTTLAATGGTTPYQNWRVSSGDVPVGLALNASTGALSGTPTSPGTYVFTVAVDDASVTPASVSVTNGSVETDAWSAIVFTPRTTVTGWSLGNSALTGTTTAVQLYGINDNIAAYGDTPAGAQYLASPFVGSWASQTVSGFSVGRPYTLRVRYALRSSFSHPTTSEAQPPFYGDALWVAGYNGSAASLFGPFTATTPAPLASNYDNWAVLDIPFIPQVSSMVFSYGLDGAAIDDVQFIPTAIPTATATKQFTVVISGNRDYGDLADTGVGTGAGNYQTLSSDSGPSHYRNTNLRLGATLDIEDDGQPSSTAAGDDTNGDDEDAISTLPAFERGKAFTIPVSVFNNTGSTARVFAFIDWNNDGDFLDPSEPLNVVTVNAGASQQSVNVAGTVPGDAVLAQVGLRVRLSSAASLGAFGIAVNGEVEDYFVTTTCPAVSFTSTTLANGTLSIAYSQTVAATGGTASYTYAVTSGTLPSGVTLNASTGVISGVPNVAGTFNFTVRATDANGCQGTQAYSVVMTCPTIAITPAAMSTGAVGTPYSQALSASGGAASYSGWTVTSGTLPAGLTLNSSSGVISGTPTVSNGAGASFTVRVTDANGCQGSQVISLKICPVITLSPATLPASMVNAAYTQAITASGGSGTYIYTLSSGTLPAGLMLNTAGTLSGTPTSTTSRTFTVTATDANGCSGSRSYTVAPACPTITISPATAAGGAVGVAYSQTLIPGGGVPSYGSWTVTSGTLPAGLALDASTGVISGTPTTGNGSGATFTVRVTDSNGCTGSQAVTLKVCPVITLSPASLPNGTINTAYNQTVTGTGGGGTYTYAVSSGALPAGLALNVNTGAISGTPTSTSAATFTIRATDSNACQGSASYTITPAPDSDFGDHSAFTTASSRMDSTLRIGPTTDVEAAATANTTATGDDTTGGDDEDGVTLPASITQGGATTITVNVTNTSGTTAYLNAWIDYNQNGSLSDAGEQIAANTVIATGTSNSNRTLSFTAPANAALGSAGVRVRLTSIATPGSDGADGSGEVEDYVATIVAPTTDYGDFSLFADAFSTGSTSLMLGTRQDLEGSATKNASGTGDDITGEDDEDAVSFPSMTAGQPMTLPVTVTNTTGSTAYLNAWIDFNNNGLLTDAGEQIATNLNVITGTNGGVVNVSFNVPTNAVTAAASLGTRFRITNVTTPGSTGGVGTGEVEDHAVVILAPLTDFGDFNGAPDVSNTASTNLRLGTLVDTEYAATKDATATGDDVVGNDDEDGVTLPSMIAGAPATIPVVVTNNTGSVAYLNAWIDHNNNGVFTDVGEQIATNTSVATGTTNAVGNISITVPPTSVTGVNIGVRVRISNDISPGSTGSGGVGEVEDYVVNIAEPATDFGDLSTIPGASSTRLSGLRMGALLDTEYVATANTTATGDDITGSDDEDGVTIPSMIAGGPATLPVVVTNTTAATAYLNAWIDYNGNGVLTDAGEQVAADVAVAAGASNTTTNLNITVPASALTAVNLATRFRLAATASTMPTGDGGAGEVEDYLVNITAPTTDFGDFSGFSDASQGVSPSLRIGASVDAEYSAIKNATATGDDTTGVDDEDGVTFPSLTAGQTVTVPVVITNTTGAPGYLNAWIDFNNNGLLTDSGEQIATNVLVATGTINSTVNLTVTAPTTATTGVNLGARFRLSAPSGLGPAGANGFSGEVEDHVLNISAPTTDFGDFNRFSNASNTRNTALRIGALVDAEYAATTNVTATGDDITGTDDEDGVVIPSMTAGQTLTLPVTVTNTTGATAYLNAWIDYNNDGVLTDVTEQIATNQTVATGTNGGLVNLAVSVPTTATTGTPLGIRVRITATASPGSTGVGSAAGEIEDYAVTITAPTLDYGDWSGIADASNGVTTSLRLGALVDAEFSPTKNSTATGDDTTGSDDEDGVTLPAMIAGQTVTIPIIVTNTLGAPASLNAWIDYNNNGSFTDAGEQIAVNTAVATGLSNTTLSLSVTVPAAAVTGSNVGVRFRLTATATPGATGTGGGVGEVEDYVVNIAAPTTDFGDFSRFAGASSTTDGNLRLGTLVDTEYLATTNLAATGDDITGSDDENAVAFPSMTAGQTVTIPVTVTNSTGAAAYLNVWIDFNNDGVLTDAGEQVTTNLSIATGASNALQNLIVTVPVTAVTETDLGVRLRLTTVSTPGATGHFGVGEVEDYVVQFARPLLDYGDWSGVADAASTASTNLRMGALVDAEYVSSANATATGDDLSLTDDEDGVTAGSMTAGAPATISVLTTNASGAAAYLNAWIDYNNNGSFADAGEQIATNTTVANGSNNTTQTLNITVPASAVTGSSLGMRFRLSSVLSPGSTGIIGTGEVEDYVINIAVPTSDFGDWNGAADASSTASSNLRMGALADTEYVSTRNAAATGDDSTGSDDEDGVTLSALSPGTTGGASVVVTNNSGAVGYLNAWIDFNNNGVFTDAGEQIATNSAVANFSNGVTRALSFAVPADAIPGQRGARFRLTSTQSPGATGASGTGEVEDGLVTVNCQVLTLAPASLSNGITGTAYSQAVTASGGLASYVYAVSSGTLPAGLALDAQSGVISGTLATTSSATFTIRATDANNCTVTRTYTVAPVCPAMTLTPPAMPTATVGAAFNQTVNVTGGTAPYTFAVASGALPAGLTLDAGSGAISGIPTSTVSTVFSIRATDNFGCAVTTGYGITPGCAAISITPLTLPGGFAGTAYSVPLAATPSATYAWSVVEGALPAGLTLNASTGGISGMPTATGSSSFTVRASTGAVTNPVLEFSTAILDLNPGDTFNLRNYVRPQDGSTRPIDWSSVSFTYTAAGANDPTTPADWNLSAFNAGQAVTVSSDDAAAGGNVGTGIFRVYLVRDGQAAYDASLQIRVDAGRTSLVNSAKVSPAIPAACSGTRAYTIAVCPVITLNPASLPQPEVSIPYSQNIAVVNGDAPYLYAVTSGTLPGGLSLNVTTGALAGTPTNTGTSTFTLGVTDANGCLGSRSYSVVTAAAPTLDYGDFSSFPSVSSTSNSRLRIGALVDAESSARTNATADGDDADNQDDEDGVILADTITPNMSASMVVNVTNTRGSTAYLHAWIDYNRNGVLVDSERIASNVTISNGTSNSNRTINFTVPSTASMGVAGVRVRLTSTSTPGPDGMDGIGEVEDYTVNIAPPPTLDFGDFSGLPSASSTATSSLRIGATVDAETYFLSSIDADGDDTTGSDDEDGVALPASVTTGTSGSLTATVTNTTGASAFLNAWIDYNRNGSLADAGEQIATNTIITTGTSSSARSLNYSLPASSGSGPMAVRVRLTSVASPGPDGQDGNGEVEDHLLNVVCPTLTLLPATLPNAAVDDDYSLPLSTTGGNAPYSYLILSGSLPAGLTMDSSGVISGQPTTSGSSSFTVHVADASGCATVRAYTLEVHTRPSVGNLVWNDVDNDGQKDSNEPGVEGVFVELLIPGADNAIGGTGGNADTVVATTVTNASGAYSFSLVSQGRYYIRITPPDNLPLPSSVVATEDNGVDNDNNGTALASTGGPVVSPVISLTAGGEPGTSGTGSVEDTIDFGLIVGNSVLWLIDEDYTHSTALHLWSFTNYRTPATTATDYGRMKYLRPTDNAVRDIAEAGDIEAMAVNRFTGEAYILSRGRISGAPSNTQTLWYYNLNDAPDNINNIVLTCIGHINMPTTGAFIEGLAYDPDTKRFYMADPKDTSDNSSTTTDRLYYLDIRSLNTNVMLATNLVSVGEMTGQGQVCRYTDGLEFSADGKLYAVDGTDDHVYQINPSTGAISAVSDNNIAGGPGGSVDVETMAWDEVSSRLIALDNSGRRLIEVTLGTNGGNIALASFVNGVPGMPSNADMEASAMYDTYPPQARVGVGNAVFIDANYNGKMDSGEGVNGVTVELYEVGDTPGVDAPTGITTTAGGGLYAFKRLLQDDYFIHIAASNFVSGAPLYGYSSVSGASSTDDDQGEDGIDDPLPAVNGINSAVFSLTKNAEPTNATGESGVDAASDDTDDDNTDLTIDFGFQNTFMAIGNLVWSDVNNNGARDAGELGIGGVTVQLYTTNNNIAGDGDDVLYSGGTNFATTSASGIFSFTNIAPGKYVLKVTPPAGYATGGTPDTADNGEDNDNNGTQPGAPGTAIYSPVITLTPNAEPATDGDTNRNSDLSVDFGLFAGITLGNLVWNDADNNGLKGGSETGVSAVTVELLTPGADNAVGGSGANADTVVQTAITNSSGAYGFTVYNSGTYYLRVTPTVALPAASSVVVSADNAVDNDSNGSQTGGAGTPILSPLFQLTAGGEPGSTGATNAENTLDFGLRACPAITVSPASLPAPTVGQAYNQSITASGGVGSHTFTVSSGSLPTGIALSSGGALTGTPTNTNPATFTVRALASDGCVGTRSYTLTPACPALTLNPVALPSAYLGATYNPTIAGVGGTAPYTFTIQGGTLPTGINFNSSGTFSGVPSVTGSFPLTLVAMDNNGCSRSFSLTLQVKTLTLGNLVFEDSNRNGLRDAGEPGVAGARVQMFATGTDNAMGGSGAAADMQVGADVITGSTGAYLFTGLPGGNYYVKVTPPADYLETGGTPATADNNINDNNDGSQPGGPGTALFSPVINLVGGAESTTDGDADADTNLSIDFGLWSSMAVGNFIFLDINGDGVRNEGESLGNIFVELYAEGATPGVTEPVSVGSSGCSCKGRYYLEGLNPGNYFLHIPASQFATGMPLEGLLPMSSVVAGDDNIGQDLLFNSAPATNGASTAVFSLRPGLAPVGSAESGGEGTLDDDTDARVDLTRDLGVVAPAGSGFAAGSAARRWLVMDETTGAVRGDASTFATWRQDNALGSAEDDPDADGATNLLEYALGTDPFSPLQSSRFSLAHESAGVTAQVTQPIITRDDIIISLETLTDLTQAANASAWKRINMAATTAFNNDGTLTRKYAGLERLLVFKNLDTGFIRLKVGLDADRNGTAEATATSAIHAWSRQSFATGTRTFSMPLARPAVFTGRVNEIVGSEVMLPYVISLPAGAHYLEAMEGALAGHRFEIDMAASSGNTLVLLDPAQSPAALAGARIAVRPHHTLGGLLPATTFTAEDRLMFFDTTANNFATLTHDGAAAWTDGTAVVNERSLAPQEAILVNARGAGATIVFTGEVRTIGLVTPLVAGTQLIGSGWPIAIPAPVAGLTAGPAAESADRLRLWNGDTDPAATGYSNWYLDSATTPGTWKAQDNEPAGTPMQQPFHGVFIVRDVPVVSGE
ncbi:MAG: GEVED domain-containing protein [Prosthecobacter sp.]